MARAAVTESCGLVAVRLPFLLKLGTTAAARLARPLPTPLRRVETQYLTAAVFHLDHSERFVLAPSLFGSLLGRFPFVRLPRPPAS